MSRVQQQPGAVCGVSCCSPCRCTTTCIFVPGAMRGRVLLTLLAETGCHFAHHLHDRRVAHVAVHAATTQVVSGRQASTPVTLATTHKWTYRRAPAGPCDRMSAQNSVRRGSSLYAASSGFDCSQPDTVTISHGSNNNHNNHNHNNNNHNNNNTAPRHTPATPRTTCHWQGEAWGRHQAPR